MPACPGVPQIVPAEIIDADTFQSFPPRFRVDLRNRLAPVAEYVRFMFADPTLVQEIKEYISSQSSAGSH